MENIGPLPQKVVDRKIIVLKARLNSAKVKRIGEDNKIGFFVKYGFLKPRPADISLIGFSKYFEPFILIGGKYSLDYCKKRVVSMESDDQTKKFFVGGEEIKLDRSNLDKPSRVVSFPADEHCQCKNEAYFVLDRFMRELKIEKIHFAPFESGQENDEMFSNIDSRKITVTPSEEIAFLRSRIVKRPSDADFIIKEIFEIDERMIIYNPMYELVFQNTKTAKDVTLLIDGITGKINDTKSDSTIHEKLPNSDKTKLMVHTKLNEVKEYEIQELNV